MQARQRPLVTCAFGYERRTDAPADEVQAVGDLGGKVVVGRGCGARAAQNEQREAIDRGEPQQRRNLVGE